MKLKLDGVTAQQLIAIGQIMAGEQETITHCDQADCDIADNSHIEAKIPASEGGTMADEQSPKPEAGKPANSATETVTPHHGSPIQSTTTQTEAVTPVPDATAADTPPPPPAADPATTSTAGETFQQAAPPPVTADPATTPTVNTTVELAKGQNGQQIPWDARIHGKAKKTNADGTWRLIQGVNRETTVPTVEAELVAALAAAPKPAVIATASTTQQSKPATSVASTAVHAGDTPPPPDSTVPTTFAELLPLVTAAKAAGTLTDEQITAACKTLGLAQFGLIATRPDLIPQAAQLLGV